MTRVRAFSAVLALLLLALLAGCGSLDININTTYEPSGDYTQKLIYTATGDIGDALAASAGEIPDVQDGWQLNIEVTSQSTTLTATRSFGKGESFNFPDAAESDVPPQLSFESTGFLIFTDYHFRAVVPPGSEWGMAAEDFSEIGAEFIDEFFRISWTVDMPGEITESNADEIDGGSATWELGFGNLNEGASLTADSRLMNWAVIAGGGAALLVAIGLIFFLARRRA